MNKAPKGHRRDRVKFDCAWKGHLLDPSFEIRNRQAPVSIRRCMKCLCSIILPVVESPIVGTDGQPLEAAPPTEEKPNAD